MKKRIKVDFVDFWPGFSKTDNYFYELLKEEFDVEITSNPDYLFFSVFGNTNQYYNCVKIFFTGEDRVPPFPYCDWAFSFERTDGKNFRLPIYLLYYGYYELVDKIVDDSLAERNFCNFVVSNGSCVPRNEIYFKLSQYKKIDSGGRFLNNIGGPIPDKLPFVSQYKFTLAYENYTREFSDSVESGLWSRKCSITSEKILEPMKVNSMPIYWGNPLIGEEFNTESFINRYEFNSDEEMIQNIIDLDNDNDLYMKKLRQPWLPNNTIPEELRLDTIKKFLYSIFTKFEEVVNFQNNIILPTEKIGRNDICYCGSGKKYKKCHG
jgi:hypothetical protein